MCEQKKKSSGAHQAPCAPHPEKVPSAIKQGERLPSKKNLGAYHRERNGDAIHRKNLAQKKKRLTEIKKMGVPKIKFLEKRRRRAIGGESISTPSGKGACTQKKGHAPKEWRALTRLGNL